jgi:hypothetical protein
MPLNGPLLKPLQHGEIVRSLGVQLGLELASVNMPFLINSFIAASLIANVLTMSCSSVTLSSFVSSAMIAPVGWFSRERSIVAALTEPSLALRESGQFMLP